MKYKIVFGLILPAIVIIALAVIASSGEIEVERSFGPLILQDAFENGKIKTSIFLGSLTLINDNEFEKKYKIPQMTACLHDSERGVREIRIGTLEFSRGSSDMYQNVYAISGKRDYSKTVEVPARGTKEVEIYLSPDYNFRGKTTDEIIASYGGYDEIVLAELEYGNCASINQDILDDAIRIIII